MHIYIWEEIFVFRVLGLRESTQIDRRDFYEEHLCARPSIRLYDRTGQNIEETVCNKMFCGKEGFVQRRGCYFLKSLISKCFFYRVLCKIENETLRGSLFMRNNVTSRIYGCSGTLLGMKTIAKALKKSCAMQCIE